MGFWCRNQMLVSLLVIFCAVIINGGNTYVEHKVKYEKNNVKVCAEDGYSDCKSYRLKKYSKNLQKKAPENGYTYEPSEDIMDKPPQNTSGYPSGCCETRLVGITYSKGKNTQHEYCYIVQSPKYGYQYVIIGLCGTTHCYNGVCIQIQTDISMLAICPSSGLGFYWFSVPAYCQCEGY